MRVIIFVEAGNQLLPQGLRPATKFLRRDLHKYSGYKQTDENNPHKGPAKFGTGRHQVHRCWWVGFGDAKFSGT